MKTTLVIEDNADNMELMTSILENNGQRTLKAETAQQGIEMALETHPDFILLDIQLPDIDGYEVLRRIRNCEIDGTIPVIAMTLPWPAIASD